MRAFCSRFTIAVVLAALAACGRSPVDRGCPPLPCSTPCGSVGYQLDAKSGCRISCECAGAPTSCPAISCAESCGLGTAQDPPTGCPTCACCHPADCQPGGCNATGSDGCPTCEPC